VKYVKSKWDERTNTQRDILNGAGETKRSQGLHPGDIVRIKSRDQIKATLDNWNRLKGCAFMEEMWAYCDTTQRVLKKVEQFLDERDYHIKKCKSVFLLDGIICNGTKDFGRCDRSCFFFWREEWIEKLNKEGRL
jgi:hypothetical protein